MLWLENSVTMESMRFEVYELVVEFLGWPDDWDDDITLRSYFHRLVVLSQTSKSSAAQYRRWCRRLPADFFRLYGHVDEDSTS